MLVRGSRFVVLGRGFHNFAGSIVPAKSGLYDPAHEKDSCGVGFVVDIKGLKTHSTVTQALQVSGAASRAPSRARCAPACARSPLVLSCGVFPRRRWRTWTTAAPWALTG